MSKSIQFNISESEDIGSQRLGAGEHIGGFKIRSPFSQAPSSLNQIFDTSKHSRSVETTFDNLAEGMMIDICYQKSSNTVNTPYRIVSLVTSHSHNEKFDVPQITFNCLLEPLIQNASLIILAGNERIHSNSRITEVRDIYYKSPWDTPDISPDLTDLTYLSEYNRIGFKPKERRFSSVKAVYDEVIGEVVGRENELAPLLI